MKLVLATPLFPPEFGGPATYAEILAEQLPRVGVEIAVVPFSSVRSLPRGIRHIAYYWRLRSALKRSDAILALDPFSVGIPAMHAARHTRKPLYVKIVGDYAWEQGRQRFGINESLDSFVRTPQHHPLVLQLQKLQRKVAHAASRVIVPSRYLQTIVEAWGVPGEQIQVIRNAVSIKEIGSVPVAVQELPKPVVVTVGRLVPWKGIAGVIEAVSHVHASLAIVGDGPERESLEGLAHAAGKLSYVFTGGIAHADVLATLSFADVFVLNSSYEGLSHLLLEAVALGVPVVATDAGGNREALMGYPASRIVPVGDTQALADAIAELLTERPARIRAHPDVERLAVETAQLLSRV